MNNRINAVKFAKDQGYELKLITSIDLFDNYDMFHNIFERYEEPCRRLIILTKDSSIEELYEPSNGKIPFNVNGSIAIKEFTINTNIESININDIFLTEEETIVIKAMM